MADLLLMDERIGVRLARSRGFDVTGTLGILIQASHRGLVSIDDALQRLATTRFRRSPGLFEAALRQARKI